MGNRFFQKGVRGLDKKKLRFTIIASIKIIASGNRRPDAHPSRNNMVSPIKKTISYRNSRNIMEKSGFGVWMGLEAIFTVNFIEILAQKLRRIILLHFGTSNF